MAAAFGLSSPQFTVFTVLSAGEPMTMGQIGEQSDLPTSSLTALVDRLAELELVSREAHPSDRRAIQVRLTAQGHALAGLVADETIRATARIAASLANSEIDGASEAIRQLLGGYQQYVATLGRTELRPLTRRSAPARSSQTDHTTSFHNDGRAHADGITRDPMHHTPD